MGRVENFLGELGERPLTAWILLAGLLLQAVFVILHGVNKELLGDGTLLALDQDASLPTWITIVLFALGGLCAALLAMLRPRHRLALAALAAYAFLFSLEQTAQIHTGMEDEIGDPVSTLVEMAVGLGLVIVVVLASRALDRPYSQLLLLSIATIVISAFASQMNSSFSLPYAGVIFFQTVEEVTEMLTATLFIAATAEPLLRIAGALPEGLRPPALGSALGR